MQKNSQNSCIFQFFVVILQRKMYGMNNHIIKNVLLVLMALVSLSCNANQSPKKVVSLSYHQTSSNAWPDVWFDLSVEKDGTCTLTNCTRRFPKEALRAVVPAEVADTLAQIAEEEKMDQYEYRYEPPVQVYDGWQWELHIFFDDKTSIISSGRMERPSGEGLKHLENYLKEVWTQVDESKVEIVDIW